MRLASLFFPTSRSRRGQSLLEAIVAITALVVGLGGIFTLLSSALRNNRVVSDQATATYLAAEGIEVVKNMLDHNATIGAAWGTGFANGDFEADYTSDSLASYLGQPIRFDATTGVYGYAAGTATNFVRKIKITFVRSDEIAVNSTVSWTTGGTQSNVNLEDHFMNWRL